MRRALLLVGLCACAVDDLDEGISVGNPSLTYLTTATSSAVELTSGRVMLRGVAVLDEDGTIHRTIRSEPVDLVEGSMVELPTGSWRRLTLNFTSEIRYRGRTPEGAAVDLILDVPEVRLVPEDLELQVDGEAYVAELAFPNWLNKAHTVTPLAQAPPVEPGSQLHDTLADALQDASALYVDLDENGRLSTEERSRRRAAGVNRRDP